MEKSTDPLQEAFGAIVDSVGFVQHVSGPTHCHSHTLDLVLSHGIHNVFTGRATCPRPAVFNSLETAGAVEILLMIGYEKPTDIYS